MSSISGKWYFWKDNQVVERKAIYSWAELITLTELGLLSALSVDPNRDNPLERYGLFDRNRQWKHVPIELFPPEFRVQLLLLGIS